MNITIKSVTGKSLDPAENFYNLVADISICDNSGLVIFCENEVPLLQFVEALSELEKSLTRKEFGNLQINLDSYEENPLIELAIVPGNGIKFSGVIIGGRSNVVIDNRQLRRLLKDSIILIREILQKV